MRVFTAGSLSAEARVKSRDSSGPLTGPSRICIGSRSLEAAIRAAEEIRAETRRERTRLAAEVQRKLEEESMAIREAALAEALRRCEDLRQAYRAIETRLLARLVEFVLGAPGSMEGGRACSSP
jgi:hypothetical protein